MAVGGDLYYAGAVRIVHMLLLGFDGFPLRSSITQTIASEAIRGLEAIHSYGVVQNDLELRIILFHPDRQRIIWHDYERAEVNARVVLGETSPNSRPKRRFLECEGGSKGDKSSKKSMRELRKAKAELTELVSDAGDKG